ADNTAVATLLAASTAAAAAASLSTPYARAAGRAGLVQRRRAARRRGGVRLSGSAEAVDDRVPAPAGRAPLVVAVRPVVGGLPRRDRGVVRRAVHRTRSRLGVRLSHPRAAVRPARLDVL